MANKRKDPKTTDLNKLPLNRTTKQLDEYFDIFELRQKPISDAWLERLAKELIEYTMTSLKNIEEEKKGSNHYFITQFFRNKGIISTDISRWKERNKAFKEAYNFCLEVFSDARAVGGLVRKLEPGLVRTFMVHYDSDWKEVAKKEWEVKAKNSDLLDVNPVYHITMNNITSREEEQKDSSPTPTPTPEEVARKINSKMTKGIKQYGESRKTL